MSEVKRKFGPQLGRLAPKSRTAGLHSTSPVTAIGRSVTACIVVDRTPGIIEGTDDKFIRPSLTDEQWEKLNKALLKVVLAHRVWGTEVHVTNITMSPVMLQSYVPAGRQDQLRYEITGVARRYSRDILLTFGTVELVSSALPIAIIRRAA